MYMLRAYQSPCSGTHCGLQCAQIPNFASRNQSGQRYAFKDSQNGRNGPSGTLPRKKGESAKAFGTPASASADAPLRKNERRFKIAALLQRAPADLCVPMLSRVPRIMSFLLMVTDTLQQVVSSRHAARRIRNERDRLGQFS